MSVSARLEQELGSVVCLVHYCVPFHFSGGLYVTQFNKRRTVSLKSYLGYGW